jgi:hypothetical protein
MAQDHGLVEDEAVVLGRGGPDTRIKRRSRSPASGLPWAPLMRRSSSVARIAARLAARKKRMGRLLCGSCGLGT